VTARHDDGTAALLTTMLALAMLILASGLTVHAAHVMRGADAARVAADAAALAVLSGSSLAGGTGQLDLDTGRQVATANGATLVGVDTSGWPLSTAVTVAVDIRGLPPGLRPQLRATAAARLHPPGD
jgi:Flp pilus assembly protein TadG